MNEERMEQLLQEAGAEYNLPPETPRELMGERVRAAREGQRGRGAEGQTVKVHRFPIWRVAVGLAAVLAAGIAIGRFTAPSEPGESIASGVIPEETLIGQNVAYQMATTDHLSEVEMFLMTFRAEARAGSVQEAEWTGPARRLLLTTRLLQGSSSGDDVPLSNLLDDVELVLAQIAQFSADRTEDLEFIDQGIRQRGVLLKLRSAVPSGVAQLAS
jgi:hypothetical protein